MSAAAGTADVLSRLLRARSAKPNAAASQRRRVWIHHICAHPRHPRFLFDCE